ATEIRPLVSKLLELKTKASTFVASVKDDDEWEYDEDKVDEHNQLRDDITATVAAFWAAERTCHNKITAIWGGTQMVAGDGSERTDQYGFNAEDMKNAKLPWGDPVEERHHWYEVGHWVKSFVWDGLIVDGVWGTIKGLGTLVGFGGWDAMGQAWKGLAQLATGLVITSMPGIGTAFWLLPDDKLPSWLRDSRTAMKETGKALVAWDEWGKNPGRAAGAVTFNVLTTVFTGGAGGAAAGAGKAGAVAKALSVAGKAGRVIDPMTYIAKGAGAGLSKIGDITKALKGMGNIEIPKLPEDAIPLPEGTVRLPDGTVHFPEGAVIPEGATKLPDGNVKLPDNTPAIPEGSVKLPTDEGAPARYYDPQGNLLDENGTVLKEAADGPGDIVDQPEPHTPTAGSDVPRVDSPVREPALAGAGTHTAGNAGNAAQHISLGNSLDTNLGDVGRVGDNVTTAPAVHAGSDLPGSSLGDHIPGGTADHLPGGGVGDNTPANSIDTPAPAGVGDNAVPGTSTSDHATTGHTTETGTSGRDLSGSTGGASLPGHGTEPPAGTGGLDDVGGLGDDVLDQVGGHGDDPATPGHEADEGAGHGGHHDERQLTVEERKRIQDEHVQKANDDPEWRKEHYDKRGHRLSKKAIVDGVELPVLKQLPDGSFIAKYDMPHGPSETTYGKTPLGRDSAHPGVLPDLDKAAKNRISGMELTRAERAHVDSPSTATETNLKAAQESFRNQVGDLANNSKLGEKLGEEAARRHVIPKMFPEAVWVDDLPRTANGANMFDDLYKLDDDGAYLVVEEKAPSGDLEWRDGVGEMAQGMRVKQGTKAYAHTIATLMWRRGGRDRELAEAIFDAMDEGKLQYVLVKVNENTGTYAGSVMEHFNI
ncbi:hypothetical protein, partial [Streptomyces sp. NPDC001388]|uniref:hypothetical protein n=1 Tax=Streptomyces sp. NPDC001388 TaxID=3364568 RepID=UPI00369C07CA